MSETQTPPANKIVVEYQATDEQGNPIGKPTRIEADSWEEMSKKQTEAHINAMRWANRLKNAKPTVKAPEPLQVREMSADEEFQTVTDLFQPGKARKAFRKLLESELPITQLEQDSKALREATAKQNRLAAAHEFKTRHLADFYDCTANGNILRDYLTANNLEWTVDNLEIAFAM